MSGHLLIGDLLRGRGHRCWEAPAITELPIATATKAAANADRASGQPGEPPAPPAAPTTKLGFAFEMSFPLAVRTE